MKWGALLLAVALGSGATVGNGVATGTPVERVVKLLEELRDRIEKDGHSEQQMYDKYACWCEEATARKSKAIEDARDELQELGQTIFQLKGRVAVFTAEISKLNADITDNLKSQRKAKALREKEHVAYDAETSEMKQAIAALEKAVLVLRAGSKQTSLLQQKEASTAVQNVLQVLPVHPTLKLEHVSLLSKFTRADLDANYAPQSLTIQGILGDMYDTFTLDLEQATLGEAKQQRAFEELMFDLYEELVHLKKILQKKEKQRAEAEEALAESNQGYDDTESQMKADLEFFKETKATCISKNDEWKTRKQLRNEELHGIIKALEVLTSDDARELFAKSIIPGKSVNVDESKDTGVDISHDISLFQVSSSTEPVARAYAALKAQATQAHSFRLAALAVQVHDTAVGHFEDVIAAIDKMVGVLQEEAAADIAKRNQCVEQFHGIKGTVANVKWLIKNNKAKIGKLEGIIEMRTEEKEQTIEHIAEVTQEMIDMKAQREQENAEFLEAKKDDQDAIKLLKDARNFMKAYYKKHDIDIGPVQGNVKDLALAQREPEFEVSPDQAPDLDFSHKGHRKLETKGIVQLITQIIEDANDEIKVAMANEEKTQLEYERMYNAAKELKAALEEKKTNLETAIAEREQEKTDEGKTKKQNEGDLKDEEDYKVRIKPDCDWIIGAFEKRQKAREAELLGLGAAKDYLAGESTAESLLEKQKKVTFDDSLLPNTRFLGLKQ